jgi:hypothetical protein
MTLENTAVQPCAAPGIYRCPAQAAQVAAQEAAQKRRRRGAVPAQAGAGSSQKKRRRWRRRYGTCAVPKAIQTRTDEQPSERQKKPAGDRWN